MVLQKQWHRLTPRQIMLCGLKLGLAVYCFYWNMGPSAKSATIWQALYNAGHKPTVLFQTKERGGAHKNPKNGRHVAVLPRCFLMILKHFYVFKNDFSVWFDVWKCHFWKEHNLPIIHIRPFHRIYMEGDRQSDKLTPENEKRIVVW